MTKEPTAQTITACVKMTAVTAQTAIIARAIYV